MKKVLLVFAIALAAVFVAFSQTNGSRAKKSSLDDTWELVSGQPLPKRNTRYQDDFGRTLYFCCLRYGEREAALYRWWNLHSERKLHTEHMDFASDQISAGLIGKDQPLP